MTEDLHKIAELFQEILDRLENIEDCVSPEETDTCEECGVALTSAVGTCNEEDCPYVSCETCR